MRVKDMMSSPVLSVAPDRGIKAIAQLLDRNRVAAVPVVENGQVVGIVSKSDLVTREQAFELDAGWIGRRLHRPPQPRQGRTARDVMTSPALTVAPTLSAVGAAWLMTEHDAHHLPVVDRDKLVGIVSRSDLVRAFARSDDQIREEIVGEVLPAFSLSANDVQVSVSNGEVILSGAIEDELTARCLPHAVQSVVGVVEIDSRLEASRRIPLVDVVSPTL
jgi:CBS domain-containing protein